jgi:hypothetical protein
MFSDHTILFAFSCPDKSCSRESGEAHGTHLLGFHRLETGFRDQSGQLLYAASPGRESAPPGPPVPAYA